MSELDDKISTIQTLLNSLSWRKLALLTAFLGVVGFSYALFDNRYAVYEFFSSAKSIPPSKPIKIFTETKKEIDEAVASSAVVVAIQVFIVDFERNTRASLYIKIDDPNLQDVYNKFALKSPPEFPLFNNDLLNNERLVNLVNGNFVCRPYKETLAAKLVPESISMITTVCSGPIPPFYGRFSGIINIYLSREIRPVEVDQVNTLSKRLGLLIYNNDFR